MAVSIPLIVLITILSTTSATGNADEEVIDSLVQAYSTDSKATYSKSYFRSHGKKMFEQISMLDSMALAKLGYENEARDQLVSLAIQSLLADLPTEYQIAGDLLRLFQYDRSFFSKTIAAVRERTNVVSAGIKRELTTFRENPTDKPGVQRKIDEVSKNGKDAADQKIIAGWEDDVKDIMRLVEMTKPTTNTLKAWHFYGDAKYVIKNIAKLGGPGVKGVGPLADIIGIGIGAMGLHDAIVKRNTKGIITSVLAIVGGVLGLGLFAAAQATGIQVLSTISGFAGVAFFIVPMIISLAWPRSTLIEVANKLSENSQHELYGYLNHLKQRTDQQTGANSFGWLYQMNSAMLLEKTIKPNTPVKFVQPSCIDSSSSPCSPKQTNYNYRSKQFPYLLLGTQRQSVYTKRWREFQVNIPYDFLGVPTGSKFCGNTIIINTKTLREYLEHYRPRSHGGWTVNRIGVNQRDIVIDTRTVPNYNDVDLGEWKQWNIKTPDGTKEQHCEPDSDRISIDELSRLSDYYVNGGNVIIVTGAGQDMLSINGLIRTTANGINAHFLKADLGKVEEGNMLSVGAALNILPEVDDLVAGVKFDNSDGKGELRYIRDNFRDTKRLVGFVKGVTVFKGSRLHDIVIMGSKGPFTVIQNRGANEYKICMRGIMAKPNEWPFRFEIMDTSGNRPFILVLKSGHNVVSERENNLIKLKVGSDVVVEIRVTGYVTEVDLSHYDNANNPCSR